MKQHAFYLLTALLLCGLSGCGANQGKLTSLQSQNAELAETLRQDRVRLANVEEQNRQLQLKLADAEKAVAVLHDTQHTDSEAIKRR